MALSGWTVEYHGKKGTCWRIRLRLATDPATGKRPLAYHTEVYATEREAKRALARLLADAERGKFAPPARITMRELLYAYLNTEARRAVRPTTLEDYESQVRIHVLPALGNLLVQQVTTPMLQRYYDDLVSSGASLWTARNALQRVHSALAYAVRAQYVLFNAADGVRKARLPHLELQVWTPEQARRFLVVAATHRLHPLWHLALHTGMRRGELLGLRWQDINLDGATLSIRRSLNPIRGGRIAQNTKSGRARLIDIDTDSVALLRAHYAEQGRQRLRLGTAWQDAGVVLSTSIGTTVAPRVVSGEFQELRAVAGLPHIRFHDLRHTAATLMLLSGTHIKVISERLGHASVQITIDTYMHLLPSMGKEAAEQVRRLLASGGV